MVKQKFRGVLKLFFMAIFIAILAFHIISVEAVPRGPTVTILDNSTKNTTTTKVNVSINDSAGGYIFTIGISSDQQNNRWKAYVGNVTGTLTLEDAYENTIFQWSLTSVTGEVYATRTSTSINWSGINCTWISQVGDMYYHNNESFDSNRSPEMGEIATLSQSDPNDNITVTFDKTNHSSITVGTITIGKNECFSVQTWQRDAAQVFADSDDANFTEVILYDGAFNKSGGNVIYATFIEDDKTGFDSDETYDFQMLLPENGASDWESSTAYYFYVELA